MKKKGLIIASLMILVLSFVFFSCGDTEEDLSVVPDAVKTKLKEMGYTGTLYTPAGSTYDMYKEDSQSESEDGVTYTQKTLAIVWQGTNDLMADYKAQWPTSMISAISLARMTQDPDSAFKLTLNGEAGVDGLKAQVFFTSDGEPSQGLKANSIVFMASVTTTTE